MKHIVVTTDEFYYQWQAEVMLNNLRKVGVSELDFIVVGESNLNWLRLQHEFSEFKFYFYADSKKSSRSYSSSAKFLGLSVHYHHFPELEHQQIFYHDVDVIFTKLPKIKKTDKWLLSDTRSYIGADYIFSKGHSVYLLMCNVMGMRPDIPIQNKQNSGGAQYIIVGVDSLFWRKCEVDAERLYIKMTEYNNFLIKRNPPGYNPLQIWCADMWVMLWNAWKIGIETEIISELNFKAATDIMDESCSIVHNAGVTSQKILFAKANYTHEAPYKDIDKWEKVVLKEYASWEYLQSIKEAYNNSVLIDRGVGDSIEKFLSSIRVPDLLKAAGLEDCGCTQRKEFLNKLMPYKK